ncbi:MAG: NADH-quinone oxidoreductase subunit N [Anaerolineales bacterium]|nr:NADH-quinone oxidoreductase subunit N [Anaerolineales bacterium]MCW5855124.1 NADH-quinone oxidoreductase subunit N [Anaerolineales bacterium]
MPTLTPLDFQVLLPQIILVAWACALLLVSVFARKAGPGLMPGLTALGLLVTGIFVAFQFSLEADAFGGMLVADGFSAFLSLLLIMGGLLTIALSTNYMQRMGWAKPEYYVLMLFSISGMMLMGSASDLMLVFLALELLSIPLYILAAIARPDERSEEAGLKYFLLGAFASGFLLYGVALVYGATGSTGFSDIVAALGSGGAQPLYLTVGAGLILVGLGFKVAAVPFHMWTPDVYQGSPTSVTAFMALGAKAAGFAALLRVLLVLFPGISDQLTPVLSGLAVATLLVGNLLAIRQSNVKRMLAYSSISHAGFVLMAVSAYGSDAARFDLVASVLFYLLAFAFASFGSWAVVMALEHAGGKGLEFADYAGLGRKAPGLAAAMVVFMLSFTGVPPTLGFAGKFYLFRTVLEAGQVGLALVGVLTSLISAYYYLRLVVVMYMQPGTPKVHQDKSLAWTAGATAVATVVLFLFAQPLFGWAAQALLKIF